MKYMKYSLLQTLKRAQLECVAERLEDVRSQVEVDRVSVVADSASTVAARSISSAEEAQGDIFFDLRYIYDPTLSDSNKWAWLDPI